MATVTLTGQNCTSNNLCSSSELLNKDGNWVIEPSIGDVWTQDLVNELNWQYENPTGNTWK